jgi:hypothetical protein
MLRVSRTQYQVAPSLLPLKGLIVIKSSDEMNKWGWPLGLCAKTRAFKITCRISLMSDVEVLLAVDRSEDLI